MSKPRKHLGTSSIKSRAAACDADHYRNKAADQALTLTTLCDMVLGEDAPKRDDDTLVRAVRVLLNNQAYQWCLSEVLEWHSDPESPDYNECEKHPCHWCSVALELVTPNQKS